MRITGWILEGAVSAPGCVMPGKRISTAHLQAPRGE